MHSLSQNRHYVGNMTQIVGQAMATALAPPSRGGTPTTAHRTLLQRGVHPQVVANLDAVAAASAASAPSGGTAAPHEVPMVGNGPREFPMGFGLTAIAAGAQQIINANPQVNFRPSRLVIPDNVAPSFQVNDLKIGMRSQFVAPGSLPAASFTEKAVGTAMSLDTVNVGQFVTLDVTNVSTQAANFAASLFGTTLNS